MEIARIGVRSVDRSPLKINQFSVPQSTTSPSWSCMRAVGRNPLREAGRLRGGIQRTRYRNLQAAIGVKSQMSLQNAAIGRGQRFSACAVGSEPKRD